VVGKRAVMIGSSRSMAVFGKPWAAASSTNFHWASRGPAKADVIMARGNKMRTSKRAFMVREN